MKLYKYRSLRRNLDFILDILLSERLYCADYSTLNDPLEGYFVEETGPILGLGRFQTGREVSEVQETRETARRICSLSKPLSNIVLWSHYAEGHTGVAIEIEFPEGMENALHEVRYVDELPTGSITPTLLGGTSAEEILSVKTRPWEHEHEYRIIQTQEYFPIGGRITAVYIGARASPLHVGILKRCVPPAIPLFGTRVSWRNFTVEIAIEVYR